MTEQTPDYAAEEYWAHRDHFHNGHTCPWDSTDECFADIAKDRAAVDRMQERLNRAENLRRKMRKVPDEVTLNRLAQTFYEAAELPMAMTDKPKVVEGLRAVFIRLYEGHK